MGGDDWGRRPPAVVHRRGEREGETVLPRGRERVPRGERERERSWREGERRGREREK